jgi:hypothetical protein
MSEVPAAGWYPDPQDGSSERWWGGTDWTANTRPLSQAPPPPPPPLPAAVALPPAGWYPDPENAAGEKWFDGAEWTQATRQRPSHQYAGAPGQPVGVPGQPVGLPRRSRFGWVTYGNPGRSSRTNNPFVGLLVGLIFMGVGPIIFFTSQTPGNMSATTTGTVTSVPVKYSSSSSSTSSSPTCTPVAQFAVGGQTYTARMSAGVWPCPWTVGQPIGVAYDPASPTNAMIPTTGMMRFMPWLFTVIGALAAGLSLRVWWRKRAATQ